MACRSTRSFRFWSCSRSFASRQFPIALTLLPKDVVVGEIRNTVLAHAEDIKGLLARRHALDIKVFGSVARDEDREDSDVDFLVEFGPGASILDQIHLELDLRALLNCDVDVIPVGALKNRDAHLLAEAVSL